MDFKIGHIAINGRKKMMKGRIRGTTDLLQINKKGEN